MSIIKQSFILLCAVAVSVAEVSGQARSPFTTFGLGEPYGDALIHNQGMGGIGVSQPQLWYINNQNPALLVYNTNTIFQAGIVGESKTISSQSESQEGFSGNLNYLTTAFPIKPTKWTSSLGLMPYTFVNYRIGYEEPVRGTDGAVVDTLSAQESGTGGITQFYWSNGVRLTRQLSVGLKAAYHFGPIKTQYASVLTNPDQTSPFVISVNEKTSVKDFVFSLSTAYVLDSLGGRDDYRLTLGAVYTFGTDLRASRRAETTRSTAGGSVLESDTLFMNRGRISIPGGITFGVGIGRGIKWSLGTEFSYQDWASFSSVNQDDEGLGESWRAAFGGEFTPDALAYENYLKRVTYRAGASYEQYPFLANNKAVKDFGVNFGLSLPAGRSSLDLAFKVGKRGDRSDNTLEENYFKVYFGITFNDQWFIKRKFD